MYFTKSQEVGNVSLFRREIARASEADGYDVPMLDVDDQMSKWT